MLKELYIRNYALIDEIEIHFDGRFNIITGETGAGKSIMLGALGLILGERADLKATNPDRGKCIVEGRFSQLDFLREWFVSEDLDYQDINYLRREINSSGKSRAFVNDSPVDLKTLRDLGSQLVDMHSQHSHLLLQNPAFRIDLLDAYASNSTQKSTYKTLFRKWKSLKTEVEQKEQKTGALQNELDYLQFQLSEIEALQPEEGEYERNEEELQLLNNSEKIGQSLSQSVKIVNDESFGLLNQLNQIKSEIGSISRHGPQFEKLYERLESSLIEIRDIASELEMAQDNLQFDPARLDFLHDKQNQYQKLMRKHQLEHPAELLELAKSLSEKIKLATFGEEDLEALKADLRDTEKALLVAADSLRESRSGVREALTDSIVESLRQLGIPDAQFSIELASLPLDKASYAGMDSVQFYFSANAGRAMGPLSQVASGGELSRIMLALKSLLAGSRRFPTLIFDEIDMGISGEVAVRMGQMIKALSEKHQVVSITHLPQIAAMGQAHFKVSKETQNGLSSSKLELLNTSERTREIGEMIAGKEAGEKALSSAKELLQKFAAEN